MNRSKRRFCACAPAALLLILAGAARATPRVIRIEARKFAFSPDLIRIAPGEEVMLELLALDFAHGFSVPGLKLHADLIPGQVVTLRVKPDQAGDYVFLCDNFCGGGHEAMHGNLRVAPP